MTLNKMPFNLSYHPLVIHSPTLYVSFNWDAEGVCNLHHVHKIEILSPIKEKKIELYPHSDGSRLHAIYTVRDITQEATVWQAENLWQKICERISTENKLYNAVLDNFVKRSSHISPSSIKPTAPHTLTDTLDILMQSNPDDISTKRLTYPLCEVTGVRIGEYLNNER